MSTSPFQFRYLPQLRDALDRYEHDPNFATEGALMTAWAAFWGEDWARHELDTNPDWVLA